ncbi:hypothetical protein BDR26DRAFT_866433 [Obelidium mucronatum]|nr:hypothetical protein BDR26DRAFT_866433 [Obelidium mucronatum]
MDSMATQGPSFLATIVGIKARNIVSRVCSSCGRKVDRESTITVCGNVSFFCEGERCKEKRRVGGKYVIQMTLLKGNQIIKAVAFDGVANDLIGMIDEKQLVNSNPYLSSLLELHLSSLHLQRLHFEKLRRKELTIVSGTVDLKRKEEARENHVVVGSDAVLDDDEGERVKRVRLQVLDN